MCGKKIEKTTDVSATLCARDGKGFGNQPIDGVVEEAKQLGIETRTPNEIADMLNLWEQEDEL